MIIQTRTLWGGPREAIGYATAGAKLLVVAHHSHSPHRDCGAPKSRERADMMSMHRYHVNKDWGGIGYNFCIFQSGNIYEGRGWGRVGAHTANRNSSSVGICFVIDGENNAPTSSAIEAFRDLVSEGIRLGHISTLHRVAPHDEFQNKVCPGKKVKMAGILGGVIPPVHHGHAVSPQPTLRFKSGGKDGHADISEAVRQLQRLLGMPDQHRTGYFGEITQRYVTEFQRAHGLKQDGIVGPKTWELLLRR